VSQDSLERHEHRWRALPAFPAWPYVMTDDDVNAWGDMIYMRGMVDEIAGTCARTSARIPATAREMRGDFCSVEFDIDLYLDPWPVDQAEKLLSAWREQVAA
jgi:hypothetical protein